MVDNQNSNEYAAGDSLNPACALIEMRLTGLPQIFNPMDPAFFGEQDLARSVEEFIVSRAKDAPRTAQLALLIYLAPSAGLPQEADGLRNAIHAFFRRRFDSADRRLRDLLRRGRASLMIGLAVLGILTFIAGQMGAESEGHRFAVLLREGCVIGGWVAMWRPMEVFLYDWWPISSEKKLYDRMANMLVRVVYEPSSGA